MSRSRSERRGITSRNAFEALVPEDTDCDSPAENWQTVEKKQEKNTQQTEAPSNNYKRERYKSKKNSKTEPCTYYPNCARGDKCWFSHDPEVIAQARASTASGSQSGPPQSADPSSAGPSSAGPSWPSSSGSHPKEKPQPDYQYKHKMCMYHIQGHCSRGSACTYAQGPSELRPLPQMRSIECPLHYRRWLFTFRKRRGAASQSHSTNSDGATARENGHANGPSVNEKMAAFAIDHGHIDNDDEAPDAFCCPITHDVLRDPVVACDGYSYERDAIKDWLRKHDTSPMTNEKLESKHLIPNLALRAAIRVMYS
ncbi:probable U-box domain-containing protein 37 at C-terminar half [Coccomyxa sp. Obi]|nr:probable U-box domain-containing protein 37 at C-terminar half [Coccomyxa sp. Obi]